MTYILSKLLLILPVVGVVLGAVAYMILVERKVAAFVQDRYGPNRVGPWGLLQPLADGLKFLFKEDVIPGHVDKWIYILAPGIILIPALIGIAVVPIGGTLLLGEQAIPIQIASVDIGVLYVLAVGSLGIYGVVLGAWASNNKYAMYGGLRAAAQMLSYEIPMALAVLTMVTVAGTLRLETFVEQQYATGSGVWNIILQPMTFLIFLITIFAETNRAPFDLPEAEQELIAGYHVEYSSMKLALFFLAEYSHMITASAVAVVLFFGGWHLPFLGMSAGAGIGGTLLKIAVFAGKVGMIIVLYMWVRWTLPRFRFDQVMTLCWKGLVPLSMALLLGSALIVYYQWPWWMFTALNVFLFLALILLVAVQPRPLAAGNQPVRAADYQMSAISH